MAAPRDITFAFLEYVCLFFGISGALLLKLDQKQPKPYMDEIFHIPQVQRYCEGKFKEWDPMITTLPGLYMSTIGIYQPLSRIFGFSMQLACSSFWLRSVNVIFAVGNALVIKFLLRTINKNDPRYEDSRGMVMTVALSTFPVLYFFTFLYYTDPGSTFCVLLMYLLALQDSHIMAAGMGVIAVLFRQTNIVWVVFTAGVVASDRVIQYIQPEKKGIARETQQNFEFFKIVLQHLLKDLKQWTAGSKKFWFGLISTLMPYGCLAAGFIAFVILNGSIVVGAKTDHQASLHFPQLFYFASFSAGFAIFHILTPRKVVEFLKFLYRRPIIVLLFLTLGAVLVWKFTYEHKYLLADNRHYTFYVWHKVYKRHEYVKYALIPGYLFAWWSIFSSLHHQNFLWKLVYFVCVSVNLIPQMLLEFRYFIVPYLMFRLHSKFSSYTQVVLEIGLYIAVNVLTLYLFLEKPFTWPSSSELQRFLW